MFRLTRQSYQWMFYLAVGCLFGAVVVRTLINYRADAQAGMVLGWLALWLFLFIGEGLSAQRWSSVFPIYLILQAGLTVLCLLTTGAEDYFAVLFGILSMQVTLRLNLNQSILWISLFAALMAVPMIAAYGVPGGLAFVSIYTGGSGLLASYALTLRRAEESRRHNQTLVGELQISNQQLQTYAQQSERLIRSRQRNHLARELHDSATQTIFSMTLTTQSAMVLLEREPGRVGESLNRLNQLAQNALTEIQALIAELRPEPLTDEGLAATIRHQLVNRYRPEGLSVSLDVEGEQRLSPVEEQALYRIVQESLNNVAKHARSPHAQVRLHLTEPLWIEVADQGQGFDPHAAPNLGGVGLTGMRERATEIGWEVRVASSPGAGTCVRIERRQQMGGRRDGG